jgi:hypothetical protein
MMIQKKFLAVGFITRRMPLIWASDDPTFTAEDLEVHAFDSLDPEEQSDVLNRVPDYSGALHAYSQHGVGKRGGK